MRGDSHGLQGLKWEKENEGLSFLSSLWVRVCKDSGPEHHDISSHRTVLSENWSHPAKLQVAGPQVHQSSRVSQDILYKWLKSHCCCVHCGAQEIDQSWIRAVTGSVSLTWYITWEGTETTSLAWWVWGWNGTRCEQGLSSGYPHKSRGLE